MADNYWKKRFKKDTAENLDLTPIAIPVDCKQPETTNEAISRILYQSGQITLDAYNSIRGIEFDMPYDDPEDFDIPDYEDEMIQSSFASYEEDLDLEPVSVTAGNTKGVEKTQPEQEIAPESKTDSALAEKSIE